MRKEVMILSGKYLRLVDQDGDVLLVFDDRDIVNIQQGYMASWYHWLVEVVADWNGYAN
jgi:hypothetical protein